MIECCANCIHCINYPRNNKYEDIDYLCIINGYFLNGINKERTKIKHYSPGGKELDCMYKMKENNKINLTIRNPSKY